MRKLASATGALVILLAGATAWGIGVDSAELHLPGKGTPNWRVHSDTFDGKDLATEHFSIYTGAAGLTAEGFTHLNAHDVSSAFVSGPLQGVLSSQVWRHSDDHLLFAYQLQNTGGTDFTHMRVGNIEGYEEAVSIVDCGLLHIGGSQDYVTGDVLKIGRTTDGTSAQLYFSFQATATDWSSVRRYLMPGETSSWFYVETDWLTYRAGFATVQNGGVSQDQIPVLVPELLQPVVPEPLTATGMVLAVAGLAGYLRRRRIRG